MVAETRGALGQHLGGGGKAVIRRDVESSKGEFVFTLGVTQAYF